MTGRLLIARSSGVCGHFFILYLLHAKALQRTRDAATYSLARRAWGGWAFGPGPKIYLQRDTMES